MAYCSPTIIRTLLFTLLLSVLPVSPARTTSSQAAQQSGPVALIQWKGRPGVRRYRLQLARDARFTDIVFDRAVVGLEYLVTELAAGRYYWRVATATPETGAFSRPVAINIAIPTENASTPAPTPNPTLAPTPTPTPRRIQRPRPTPTPRRTPTPTRRSRPWPTASGSERR